MYPVNRAIYTPPMVGESLINLCACPMHRMKQHRNLSSRAFVTNHIGLALGSAPTVGGGGGQGDRRRLSLRDSKCLPVVARHMVSLHLPRRCLRRVVAHRSPPPTSHAHCQPASLTASRPRSGRSACCLLAWRRPQVSSIIIFKCHRRASPPDVTNAIAGVDIDSVGMAASQRIASLMRSLAARPRSPRRVPCIPRTLAIPRWLCRVHATGCGGSGRSSSDFAYGRSRGRQWDAHRAACARARRDRAWSAAARRRTRDEGPELAAVSVRSECAARRSQRWTPASARASASRFGRELAWSLRRRRGVAWQCMCAFRGTAAARDGQNVRRQCCCDGCAEGGAVRGTLCAIGDLCA